MTTMSMKKMNTLKGVFALIVTVLLVRLDQFVKELARKIFSRYTTIPLIKNVLHITYVKNFGAAFGMLQHQKIFLVGVTAVVILCAIFFMFSSCTKSRLVFWSLCLIVSGGIGNLIDRVFNGFVVDYIDFRLINFAVFNLADSYVCVGASFLLIYYIFIETKSESIKIKGTEEV